jgi:hypothetical protein
MENAGRAHWVLDPRLYVREGMRRRAARVLLALIDDRTRQKTVATGAGTPEAPRIGALVRELRTTTLKSRFYSSEIQDRSGSLTVCGERLPGLRDSLITFQEVSGGHWPAGLMYDLLSNASHPTPHVIVSMLRIDEDSDLPAELHLPDAGYPLKLARATIFGLLKTHQLIDGYKGHEEAAFAELLGEVD